MSLLTLTFGVVPFAIGLVSLAVAIACAMKSRSAAHAIAAVAIAVLLYVAGRILASIFIQNAWPTFVPHLLIGVCVLVASVQWWRLRRTKKA